MNCFHLAEVGLDNKCSNKVLLLVVVPRRMTIPVSSLIVKDQRNREQMMPVVGQQQPSRTVI